VRHVPIATFADAVRFLEEGINYERTRRWAYNTRYLNLSRVEGLLDALGNPHRRYRVLHVAGTKGKGSTAGAAAHLLTCAGRRTGLITSPHLVTHRERIRIDGQMIGERDFVLGVRRMQPYVEARRVHQAAADRAPTYFEMLTVLGFLHFAEQQADWAVVEVGLGGRLDSTNVVTPDCCVITTIGFDHTDKLGDTAEAIATEKGGIIKPGVPVVLGTQQYDGALSTLRRIADERSCPRREVGRELTVTARVPLRAPKEQPDAPVGWRFTLKTPAAEYADLTTPLLGAHQLGNLAAAVGAVEVCAERAGFALGQDAVRRAVAEFRMPARVEVLQRGPAFILDVAHTVESVQALLDTLEAHFPGRAVHVVFGCSDDKDTAGMLGVLKPRCISFTATQARDMPRALAAEEVAAVARELGFEQAVPGGVRVTADVLEAVDAALSAAQPDEVVVLTGSFFTAGQVRQVWSSEFRTRN
jgi:dihydrofolate synthase/folylpolyglutamate synthase